MAHGLGTLQTAVRDCPGQPPSTESLTSCLADHLHIQSQRTLLGAHGGRLLIVDIAAASRQCTQLHFLRRSQFKQRISPTLESTFPAHLSASSRTRAPCYPSGLPRRSLPSNRIVHQGRRSFDDSDVTAGSPPPEAKQARASFFLGPGGASGTRSHTQRSTSVAIYMHAHAGSTHAQTHAQGRISSSRQEETRRTNRRSHPSMLRGGKK